MSAASNDLAVPELAPTFRFQWEEVQGCFVILYPEGMVKLSPSAGEIMKRCDGQKSVSQIIADLKTQFPQTELETDVRRFLEEANEHGWIRPKMRISSP
ncbi:MAG: pyrroloquinoline quinone biosynthesis peptide chaperone PqqD [Gammaproteobacteria bacterium]|nr:pyrroloquinoline quinone biosynthesis peptide chaperone PqqD [Gammaproteobacteria bacterium]